MSHNSFGHLFRVTTWGESHGPAIGCVVDGAPPRLRLDEADIQRDLDRRRPGQSRFTTQRREPDHVRILSGVLDGLTTGTPIALQIENEDARSKDYGEIAAKFRPGHADYAYWRKYGIRDHRGGGRSSARETAMRVAAGAVARKVLGADVAIRGALVQLGRHRVDRARWDWAAVGENPFFCPDRQAAQAWEGELDAVRKAGSSVGAVIEVVASGVPAGRIGMSRSANSLRRRSSRRPSSGCRVSGTRKRGTSSGRDASTRALRAGSPRWSRHSLALLPGPLSAAPATPSSHSAAPPAG